LKEQKEIVYMFEKNGYDVFLSSWKPFA